MRLINLSWILLPNNDERFNSHSSQRGALVRLKCFIPQWGCPYKISSGTFSFLNVFERNMVWILTLCLKGYSQCWCSKQASHTSSLPEKPVGNSVMPPISCFKLSSQLNPDCDNRLFLLIERWWGVSDMSFWICYISDSSKSGNQAVFHSHIMILQSKNT